MQDVAPAVKYFRYEPDGPPGLYQTPSYGELATGQVVEASGAVLADIERLGSAGPFVKATKKEYDQQDAEALRASYQEPYIGEQE